MANDKHGGGKDQSKQAGSSGNFANDPERASEAGKKGGQHSHGGSGQANQSGSGRSQQSAVQSDAGDDDNGSEKTGGNAKHRR
jgi:uncharacterized protein